MDKPKHFAEFDAVFMAVTKYTLSNMLLNRQNYEAAAEVFEAEVQKQKEQERQKKPKPIRLKSHSAILHNLDRMAF